MKCKMYLLALSAMALATGCSNDETTELNKGNAIDFSVTAGKLTRATGEVTTTSSIKDFKVWAFTDGKTYMDKTDVNKNADGKWTYDGTKFWPETPVDFYAISYSSLADVTPAINNGSKAFTYNNTDGTYDVLYAANIGETKDNHKTAPVAVNFRHALSQIVFKAKLADNSPIEVKIRKITVKNVKYKGTLTWASQTTGPNLASEGTSDTETGDTWGKWKLVDDGTFSYQTPYDGSLTLVDLSSSPSGQIGHTLFLMPQTLTPWLKMDGENVKVNDANGARLEIQCKITDKKSGVTLWPKAGEEEPQADGCKTVYVSLDNPKNDPNREPDATGVDSKHDKWMQGKKYIYTLIFGEGAGYTPDPTDPDNPKPVLVPIKFDVTVDEFQNGGEYNWDANYPKS